MVEVSVVRVSQRPNCSFILPSFAVKYRKPIHKFCEDIPVCLFSRSVGYFTGKAMEIFCCVAVVFLEFVFLDF